MDQLGLKNNNMEIKKSIKIVPIGIASISFAICLFLWSEINGFEQGFRAAYNIEHINSSIQFVTHGPNFFDFIIEKYFFIGLCFCIYIIGKLLKEENSSQVLCISSLVVSIVLYWQLLQFKFGINNTELIYNNWLHKSLKFDYFCFFSVLILLAMQIFILSLRWSNKTGNKTLCKMRV